MLPFKTLSFIRIDAYISLSAMGCASTPVPSAVGDASMYWHACVYACLC